MVLPKNGSKDGRYVKLLVDVELNKPLIWGIRICFEEEKRWVSFKYESLPLFCFYCGKLCYGEKSCGKKLSYPKEGKLEEEYYGIWLRATNISASNKGKSGRKANLRVTSIIRQGVDKNVRKEGIWGEIPRSLILDASRTLEQESKAGEIIRKPSEDSGMIRREKIDTAQKNEEGGKENGSIIPISPMKEKGYEGEEGVSEDVDMLENGEGRKVLGAVDQNCLKAPQLVLDEIHKVESWKRIARVQEKEEMRDLGVGKENKELGNSLMGKRAFCQSAEEEIREDLGQCSKKLKCVCNEMIPDENLVEVAIQKWAQSYK